MYLMHLQHKDCDRDPFKCFKAVPKNQKLLHSDYRVVWYHWYSSCTMPDGIATRAFVASTGCQCFSKVKYSIWIFSMASRRFQITTKCYILTNGNQDIVGTRVVCYPVSILHDKLLPHVQPILFKNELFFSNPSKDVKAVPKHPLMLHSYMWLLRYCWYLLSCCLLVDVFTCYKAVKHYNSIFRERH